MSASDHFSDEMTACLWPFVVAVARSQHLFSIATHYIVYFINILQLHKCVCETMHIFRYSMYAYTY